MILLSGARHSVDGAEHMINNQLLSHFNVVQAPMTPARLRIGTTDCKERRQAPARHPDHVVDRPTESLHRSTWTRCSASLDVSVRRLLREKFILGLFDNPYVDIDHAAPPLARPSSLPPEPMPSGKRTHC